MDGQELKKLRRIISIAEELIAFSPKQQRGRRAGSSNGTASTKRIRRSGKELFSSGRCSRLGKNAASRLVNSHASTGLVPRTFI